MTHRDKFIMALEGKQPPGRVPTFELVFYLTMERFGRVHPSHRHFSQWNQMTEAERKLHRRDVADLYVQMARAYDHSAIFFHGAGGWSAEDQMLALEEIRNISGDEFFLMMHGDATFSIPGGNDMENFVGWLADDPEGVKRRATEMVDGMLNWGERLKKHGALDGFALCADYCFNDNPFLSPAMFDEFVTPYLARLCKGYRDMGFYVIKHTDGNINPILDSLVQCRPHALHSLDPQGHVDIAEIKRKVGKQVCLIGNVNCGLLDTGTDEQCRESARYALRHGMPGGGYIFSTSNCVYTGMDLRRYDLILDVWRSEGNYPA